MRGRIASGVAIIAFIVVVSFFCASPGIADGSLRLQSPSLQHIAGTDTLGRDLAGRIGYGVLVSFSIALPVSMISLILGIILAFAFSGARTLNTPFLMLSDTMKSLPPILLALFLNALSGPGMMKLVVALSIGNIPNIARLCSARVIVLRSDGPALAASLMGISRGRIFIRHILPFLMPYLGAEAITIFSASILTEASLSYLGCGVPPMIPSIGSILAEGRSVMLSAPWMILIPAVVLTAVGIALEMIVSGLSESDSAFH